eukprot:TRINITY_DN9431_c2_g1_i2.p1 TRINITY_DN9431_c2_g1~~TRINITY_DN9431_c2_g1_i2.p1  ORF type:complete len:132 (-),score=8.41 TRINITY_DN9431_c2_g1_i2:249-644(-)
MECATSFKQFEHTTVNSNELKIEFKAADTTRKATFGYTVKLDGKPHKIDAALRARANNSIKMNPTGKWRHWWDDGNIVMEQPCVVRGEKVSETRHSALIRARLQPILSVRSMKHLLRLNKSQRSVVASWLR